MPTKRPPDQQSVQRKRAKRLCSVCKAEGHDRRNCPEAKATEGSNRVVPPTETEEPLVQDPPTGHLSQPPQQIPATINWSESVYVIFDIETTGGRRTDDDIIELSAWLCGTDGIHIEEGVYDTIVKPCKPINNFITTLTGITTEMVVDARPFPEVAEEFFDFLQQQFHEYARQCDKTISHIVMVAHNGRVFDMPFLLRSLDRFNLLSLWTDNPKFGFLIDTLDIARKAFRESRVRPNNFKLGTLYEFVSGKELEGAHRALSDVRANYTVFLDKFFWNKRDIGLHQVKEIVTSMSNETIVSIGDDSDEEEDNESSTSSGEEEQEEEEATAPLGEHWTSGIFHPQEDPSSLFTEHFRSTCRSGVIRTGMQVPASYCNSPIKAWRQIFTITILEKIVKYTNSYGGHHNKDWSNISRGDLQDFISVLFLMSAQKRKDKPSNWFSSNPLLESSVAKQIISGRKFALMLRYLHCCDPKEKGVNQQSGEYDPSYKVAELAKALEARWNYLFVPFQELSLDETLLRAFGRIKFKVRIISKAARYGIKLYVITDARTSFVLKVLVYTGKYTYQETTSESTLKTVQVVQQLCEPFKGSYRTVYVDRFYTSLELMKELHEMKLYVTGTVVSNRIPRNLTLAKSSQDFKAMNRGDANHHLFHYTDKNGKKCEAGLVCWKDRNMVYCLTNDSDTGIEDECRRRSQGGLIRLKRPAVIGQYNKYMGGVDVADMRRLHCNSTIMGQNRWWLKLFFYLLDAGTSNALVLYNEAMKTKENKKEPMNIAQFKLQLVESLVGRKLKGLEDDTATEHSLARISGNNRLRCSYCSLTATYSRTRYMCSGCGGVPYCSIGSGKTGKDCFAVVHENEEIRQLCLQKYEAQRRTTKTQYK